MRTSELKQLKRLASMLPAIPLRRGDGKWVRQATNHERRLISAFKTGGRQAVEKYVDDYKAECMAFNKYMEGMQQGDNNNINLNNQQP